MEILKEVLGWSSVAFYISITIFNSMKITRYAAFGSAANDIVWAALMGWWPKVILNISVSSVNTYRYLKDFTSTNKYILRALVIGVIAGIGYISYIAVTAFLANPTIWVALQFVDLGIILAAMSMKTLKNYRILMLSSGFVGMAAYWGNTQMMIIKGLVISIMIYKLFLRNKAGDITEQ